MYSTILFQFLIILTCFLFNVFALENDQILLRKCCEEEEFLNEYNKCTTFDYNSEENILNRFPVPLRMYGQDILYTCSNINNTEIEKNVNISDFCIDKMLVENYNDINASLMIVPDSFIKILPCNSNDDDKKNENFNLKPPLINIRKCCSEQYSYSPELHICQNETSNLNDIVDVLYSNTQQYININHSFFECSGVIFDYTDTDYTFKIKDNEDLILEKYDGNKIIIKKESYCIDSTNDTRIVARVCQDLHQTCTKNTCIRKCCRDGFTFQWSKRKKTECLPGYGKFTPQFYDMYPSLKPINMTDYRFAIAFEIRCENGKYILGENEYVLARNGYIYILKSNMSQSYEGKYCAEYVKKPGVPLGLHTFLCFAKTYPFTNDKGFLYAIPTVLSCVFLIATLLVYGYLSELRNLHGKTLMFHVGSTLIAYICLAYLNIGVTGDNPVSKLNHELCIFIGFVLLLSLLMSFSWLNIMCFDIWWTFGRKSALGLLKKDIREWKRLLWYSLYACGVPILISTAALLSDYTDILPLYYRASIGTPRCFVDYKKMGNYIFFIIPITLQVICNTILFIVTAIHCSKIKSEIHRMQLKSRSETQKKFIANRAKFFMNIKLFFVMGIPWVHELLSVSSPTYKVWLVGDIFNCLLGLFIFIIFVCKITILRLLFQKMRMKSKHFHSLPAATSTGIYKTKCTVTTSLTTRSSNC